MYKCLKRADPLQYDGKYLHPTCASRMAPNKSRNKDSEIYINLFLRNAGEW